MRTHQQSVDQSLVSVGAGSATKASTSVGVGGKPSRCSRGGSTHDGRRRRKPEPTLFQFRQHKRVDGRLHPVGGAPGRPVETGPVPSLLGREGLAGAGRRSAPRRRCLVLRPGFQQAGRRQHGSVTKNFSGGQMPSCASRPRQYLRLSTTIPRRCDSNRHANNWQQPDWHLCNFRFLKRVRIAILGFRAVVS